LYGTLKFVGNSYGLPKLGTLAVNWPLTASEIKKVHQGEQGEELVTRLKVLNPFFIQYSEWLSGFG
jgi:hypothetical protein